MSGIRAFEKDAERRILTNFGLPFMPTAYVFCDLLTE
jgi:hypothetical protein